jgi:hypothetical protein
MRIHADTDTDPDPKPCRRPIFCTLYGAVDFLNVLKKGCLGGGVLLVHNEIHYVPIGDGWEEVLVRNVLHYVPVLLSNSTVSSVCWSADHQGGVKS